ncbi:MAG: Ig-like domain-containing protein [Gemmatimonadaceae bacterium]
MASVIVTLTSPDLIVGGTTQASATLKDASGNVLTGRTVSWATNSVEIATVSSVGLVTAVAAGSVSITGTSEGQSGSASLTVTPVPVASVSVTLAASSLTVGATTQATATTKDANGGILTGRSVIWASSNTAGATVNATGVVTALGAGNANITATSEGQTGSASLTVTPVPVASVSVSLATSSLTVGGNTQATATVKDANGGILSGRSVAWASSNTSVATVNPTGLVTAISAGTASITAMSESQSGSATLTVTPIPVASVSVSLAASSLRPGTTTQASATLRDANGNVLTGRSVAWSSTTETVATVNASGVVTAINLGTTTVTATSEGQSGGASLTVISGVDTTPPSIVALTISPQTVDVSSSAHTVTATARITDSGRGVIGFDFILTAPSGGIQASCQTRTIASGTSADGTWTCTATIPLGAQPGDWVIAVNGWDAAQNMQGLRTAELNALGFPTKVTVVSQNPDTTPPSIVSLTVSPQTVDVTAGGQTVTATARITDSGRGVIGFDFILTAPSGGIQASCQTRTIATGTSADGTWTCTATIPLGAQPGDWVIAVNGWDAAQNMQGLRMADLTALGFPTKVTVVSQNADTTPPSIVSLTVSPQTVDVTSGPQAVTATARITDSGRGVIGFDFILTAPSGGIQASCQTRTIASGTSADGTWSCTATIPLGAQPGDWVIAVNGWDAAQNMQGLRTPDLTALGFPTKVTVISR